MAELYPTLVQKLADLFERIDANTEAIGRLHASAPSVAWGENQRRLLDAELVARNLPGYDGTRRAHRVSGDGNGTVNPTGSKTE